MGYLDGRVALITGSGRGMGLSHALMMAGEGARVIIQDVDSELVKDARKQIVAAGGEPEVMVSDIADIQTVQAQIAAMEKKCGHIDILVNNAGMSILNTLEEASEEDYDETFNVHVKGHFFATKAVIPGMKARRHGKIVNISSIWGLTGHHFNSQYCGAKAALLGLTKAWAKEFAPYNIHVNAVAPGCVITDLTLRKGEDYIKERQKLIPLGRWAAVEEMTNAVMFLVGPQSDFVTGQCISPNGGDTIT